MDKFELRRLKLLELMHERCDGRVAVLAKKLGRSDSYVARMLYPADKPGVKRIGEDMADLIAVTFDLDRSALEKAPAPAAEARELQWTTAEESRLLSLFRSTDHEGRDSIMRLAEIVPKVLLSGLTRNNQS